MTSVFCQVELPPAPHESLPTGSEHRFRLSTCEQKLAPALTDWTGIASMHSTQGVPKSPESASQPARLVYSACPKKGDRVSPRKVFLRLPGPGNRRSQHK